MATAGSQGPRTLDKARPRESVACRPSSPGSHPLGPAGTCTTWHERQPPTPNAWTLQRCGHVFGTMIVLPPAYGPCRFLAITHDDVKPNHHCDSPDAAAHFLLAQAYREDHGA